MELFQGFQKSQPPSKRVDARLFRPLNGLRSQLSQFMEIQSYLEHPLASKKLKQPASLKKFHPIYNLVMSRILLLSKQ